MADDNNIENLESHSSQVLSDGNAVVSESKLPIRENLITTAVTFLQNPKVRQSPFAQRKAFLERKGLTEEEINAALERSGLSDEFSSPVQSDAVIPVKPITSVALQQHVPPQFSGWTKAREVVSTAVFISGATYGLYHFYKIYLSPLIFGSRVSKNEDDFEKVTRSVDELRQSVTQVISNIVELQRQLTNSHEEMVSIVKTNTQMRGHSDLGLMNIADIRDEIKSVKSLLLSRNQFPQMPPLVTPVIPAWQLQCGADDVLSQKEKVEDCVVPVDKKRSDDEMLVKSTSDEDGEMKELQNGDKRSEETEDEKMDLKPKLLNHDNENGDDVTAENDENETRAENEENVKTRTSLRAKNEVAESDSVVVTTPHDNDGHIFTSSSVEDVSSDEHYIMTNEC